MNISVSLVAIGTFILDNILAALFEVSWKYVLPVGVLLLFFTVLKGGPWRNNRIQSRELRKKFILHEARWWATSMVIATGVILLGYWLNESGISQVYTDINQFGWVYYIASFFVLLFIHDTYFYWLHRGIHHRKVYRRIHRLHHYSPTPTPLDGFAVTPSEALAEFLFVPVIALIIPLHLSMFVFFAGFYVLYNSYLHLGYEVLPRFWVNLSPFKYINTAVHHDQHHTTIKYNFGLYFNIWDRFMGTLHPEYASLYQSVKQGEMSPKKEVESEDEEK
jgi:lathosterol oxidase